MPTLVSRNTIKLAATASAVNGYYNNYMLELSRFDTVTGKQLVQKKQIISYDGATKTATIDGIWDSDFFPMATDTYKITPMYPDSRVSINFAIHTLDYITSNRYGKGLEPFKDLYLPSWLQAARDCDERSDVTVQASVDISTVGVGAVYEYRPGGVLIFQGEVKSAENGYIKFTNVLGKLTNKWNSWRPYVVGDLVYNGNNLYSVTIAGAKPTPPTHTAGTVSGMAYISTSVTLTKVSGTGPATVTTPVNGNPVRAINAKGVQISGYSLYDSDGVDYWRYLGWDEHSQRSVTRHQGNLTIDTSTPLFDNINSLLEHFGGILRYSGGRYHLEVEKNETITDPDDVRNISLDNIIGKIRLTDEGIRGSFNSLTVAYADPANKFEAKNISFFNSDFLKSDRNVPKKGNLSIPGITNYFNARLLADKFLTQSRFGLTVSFQMEPKGIALLAGRVISITQPRYGWVNKKFRIENITHNADTNIDIVAKEFDASFYAVSNVSRPPSVAMASQSALNTNIVPTNLQATNIATGNEVAGSVLLSWTNGTNADSTVDTEIFRSPQNKLTGTVTSITGGDTLVFSVAHGLAVGAPIIAQAEGNGVSYDGTYYVTSVPNSTSVKVSEVLGGPNEGFTNGSGLSIPFITARLLTTVKVPTNTYTDTLPTVSGSTSRVTQYYWVRHRINRI